MTSWQPIETAPKDGSWVLGYDAKSAYPDMACETMWIVRHGNGGGWSGGRDWEILLDGQYCKPTHWMPLPEPPND
jgi:hypothetical protein